MGGAMDQVQPVNILRREAIIYYSINFQEHINLCDFYDESIVHGLFYSVQHLFTPSTSTMKFQCDFELKKLSTNRNSPN